MILFSCSKEESEVLPTEIPSEKTFQFDLDSSSEFPVAHDVGLNYFNDITVGVISNSSNNLKIITAAGVTPGTRDAWPNVRGFVDIKACFASDDRPPIDSKLKFEGNINISSLTF